MRRIRAELTGAAGLTMLLAATAAHGLQPDELFAKVSPSVVAIHGFDTQVRPFSRGSGVVIGHETVITNCHVIAKTRSVDVKRGNATYKATLRHLDVERDLCELHVPDLVAPAVELGASKGLRIGQRVYAIGNPIGLDLTLSDGLISGFRKTKDSDVPAIQTSAPASRGSSGGGLFDADGRLIGITTAIGRDAQNITLAHPVEWLSEISGRAAEQLAAYRKQSAPVAAPDGTPVERTVVGDELVALFRAHRRWRISQPPGLDALEFRTNGYVYAEFSNVTRSGTHHVSSGSNEVCLRLSIPRNAHDAGQAPTAAFLQDCFTVSLVSERKYRFMSRDKSFSMVGEF